VGKSTLFNALTSLNVPAENFPFCTTTPNTGIVAVPDKRLDDIIKFFNPERVTPTYIEFVDIAGLVKNAHKGEGLGNQFLGHIRDVSAIAHVVRCFDSPKIVHSYNTIDPARDMEILELELILSDLEIITRQFEKLSRAARTGNASTRKKISIIERIKNNLEGGLPASDTELDENEWRKIHDIPILTIKPLIYIMNINESDINSPPSKHIIAAMKYAKKRKHPYLAISASIEADIASMDESDKESFLKDMKLDKTGLQRFIKEVYDMLDLITFFTKDGMNIRAWAVKKGTEAKKAAGMIHSDMERGFIKADVYSYDDLMAAKSESALKKSGLIRIEGHDYKIRDGNIVHFKFNV